MISHRSIRHCLKLTAIALLAAGIVCASYATLIVMQAGRDLSNVSHTIDIARARGALTRTGIWGQVRDEVSQADSRLTPFFSISRWILGVVPARSIWTTFPHLVLEIDHALRSATSVSNSLAHLPTAQTMHADWIWLRGQTTTWQTAEAALRDLTALNSASSHLPGALLQRLSSPAFADLTRRASLVAALLSHATALLGDGDPQTYLVLTQNEQEARATGGFLGAYGLIEISQGAIRLRTFGSTYVLDGVTLGPHVWPPTPLALYEGLTQWHLRDANWSPDFPETGRAIAHFYTTATSQPLAGVILVDMHAINTALQSIGPISVPGYLLAQPLNASNLASVSDYYSNDHVIGSAKLFLAAAARALFQHLTQIQWTTSKQIQVAQMLAALIHRRDLQIYLTNQRAERLLVGLGWAGSLVPAHPSGQPAPVVIAIADTNTGHNKIDQSLHIFESVTMTRANRSAVVIVTITRTYHNTVVPARLPIYDGSPVTQMFTRLFVTTAVSQATSNGFDQVWAPATEQTTATTLRADGSIAEQPMPVAVFSGYMRIPPGQSRQLTWRFTMLAGVRDIILRRQAGQNLTVHTSIVLNGSPLPDMISSSPEDIRLTIPS